MAVVSRYSKKEVGSSSHWPLTMRALRPSRSRSCKGRESRRDGTRQREGQAQQQGWGKRSGRAPSSAHLFDEVEHRVANVYVAQRAARVTLRIESLQGERRVARRCLVGVGVRRADAVGRVVAVDVHRVVCAVHDDVQALLDQLLAVGAEVVAHHLRANDERGCEGREQKRERVSAGRTRSEHLVGGAVGSARTGTCA